MEYKKYLKNKKTDKDIFVPNGKFQLNKVRERQNKIKQKAKNKPYFAPTGVEVMAGILQIQNKQLLLDIAEYKNLSQEDTDKLINQFWNISYWVPKPTKDINKE